MQIIFRISVGFDDLDTCFPSILKESPVFFFQYLLTNIIVILSPFQIWGLVDYPSDICVCIYVYVYMYNSLFFINAPVHHESLSSNGCQMFMFFIHFDKHHSSVLSGSKVMYMKVSLSRNSKSALLKESRNSVCRQKCGNAR